MKQSFSMFTILLALAATASAQEAAEVVQTRGAGELRRASEAMVTGGGGNVAIRLPNSVVRGDVVPIQYQSAGGSVSDSFQVTGITVSGDVCVIESKHHNSEGMELVDRILTQPCSKLK